MISVIRQRRDDESSSTLCLHGESKNEPPNFCCNFGNFLTVFKIL